MKIYIVMKEIDLGGHPIKAFFNQDDAGSYSEKLSIEWRAMRYPRLKALDYNNEEISNMTSRSPFYVEEVDIL